MSGPSDKAVERASHFKTPAMIVEAAHDPTLGLDRSVCLRDVLDWLEGRTGAHGGGFTCADDVRDAIEHKFGERP